MTQQENIHKEGGQVVRNLQKLPIEASKYLKGERKREMRDKERDYNNIQYRVYKLLKSIKMNNKKLNLLQQPKKYMYCNKNMRRL